MYETRSWTGCGASGGACSLKNLVGRIEDTASPGSAAGFSCTGTKKYTAPGADFARASAVEGGAAENNLTTWGYVQNPYHRVRHRSGVLRAHDRLNGVALYTGNGGPDGPDGAAPSATLFVAAAGAGGAPLITAEDFEGAGVARTAPVHTKSRLAIAHGGAERGAPFPSISAFFEVEEFSGWQLLEISLVSQDVRRR